MPILFAIIPKTAAGQSGVAHCNGTVHRGIAVFTMQLRQLTGIDADFVHDSLNARGAVADQLG